MEDSNDSDTDSDTCISLSDGSNISLHGSSDEEFSSDTDSDVESQTETQSSPCTLDSQLSDIIDDDFWSNELHNIEIAEFQEDCGPCHELDPLDHVYRYFLLMFPLAIFGEIAEETNRYAEQRAENTGQPDPYWIPTNEDEVKAYFGLWILMGINQLPDIHMYWSDNKYIEAKAKTPERRRFWYGHYPIGANEWAKPNSRYVKSTVCYKTVPYGQKRGGDIIAFGRHGSSGHMGIVSFWTSYMISAAAQRVTHKSIEEFLQNPNDSITRTTIWRYTCL